MKLAVINSERYLNYLGCTTNKTLHFKDMCDVSGYPHLQIFPNAETIFLSNCQPNFSWFELNKSNFPKLKHIWVKSRGESEVFRRFSFSETKVYWSDRHAEMCFPIASKNKDSWLHRQKHLIIVPEKDIDKEIAKYKLEPPEGIYEDLLASKDILRSSITDKERRSRISEMREIIEKEEYDTLSKMFYLKGPYEKD